MSMHKPLIPFWCSFFFAYIFQHPLKSTSKNHRVFSKLSSPNLELPCPPRFSRDLKEAYPSPVSNHSSDLPNSRLIANRTSAPSSLAFVPWGDVGKTVDHRNINKRVLLPILSGERVGAHSHVQIRSRHPHRA